MPRTCPPAAAGAARNRRCWPDQEPDHPKASRVCPITVLPCVRSGPTRPRRRPGKESTRWHMLADTRRARHRGRHPQAHPHRRGRGRCQRRGDRAADRARRPRLATGSCCSSPSRHAGRRVWAIEGTGGYGAGLTRFLQAHAEQVVELDRPSGPPAATAPSPTRWMRPGRPARRWAATSSPSPAPAGHRAALSVRLAARRSAVQAATDAQRQLHALVVAAPDTLRGRLRGSDHAAAGPHLRAAARSRPPGTSRPRPPRPACAPWPAASSS